MITKQLFSSIINNIIEQDKINQKVADALELVCDSWILYGTKDKKERSLFTLLETVMNDTTELISWWIYEDVDKFVYEDDNKTYYDLTNVSALYDYLVDKKKLKKHKITKEMLKDK